MRFHFVNTGFKKHPNKQKTAGFFLVIAHLLSIHMFVW